MFYKNHIFGTLFRGSSAEYRWHLGRRSFSLDRFLSHLARSGTCRRHFDPLRARRRPRRVWVCVVMLSACTLFACLLSAFFLSFFVFIYALYLLILLVCMCLWRLRQIPIPALGSCLSFFRSFCRIDFWSSFCMEFS